MLAAQEQAQKSACDADFALHHFKCSSVYRWEKDLHQCLRGYDQTNNLKIFNN
jgi:hypothetical protein